MTNEQILRDAAQQALKFLEEMRPRVRMADPSEVRDALKAALEQPATAQAEQEPVKTPIDEALLTLARRTL